MWRSTDYVVGNRIGWDTNYWRLCYDTASSYKGSSPFSLLKVLQTTHKLGYVFGRSVLKRLKPCSPLYNEVIILCLDLGELDAAIAIVADMETSGIAVPDETLDRVISARQMIDTAATDDTSSQQ
ncbi:hypothetical protein CK203_019741 [Vitis vinifera]|uniref:Pentatricopeptide repeat-containing protein n=1 Tax=Vitis vinifera TaxID=29760 RepID=A0A438JQP9_VITVI|nr:hypothetical protein CK203_019741 [Vitis vinifera]